MSTHTETHTCLCHIILQPSTPPPPAQTTRHRGAQDRLAAAGSVMGCSNETLQRAERPMNKTPGTCLSGVWALVTPHHYSFTRQSPHLHSLYYSDLDNGCLSENRGGQRGRGRRRGRGEDAQSALFKGAILECREENCNGDQ